MHVALSKHFLQPIENKVIIHVFMAAAKNGVCKEPKTFAIQSNVKHSNQLVLKSKTDIHRYTPKYINFDYFKYQNTAYRGFSHASIFSYVRENIKVVKNDFL